MVINHPASLPAPTNYQFYLEGDVTPALIPGAYVTLSDTGADTFHRILTSEHIFNSTIGATGVTKVTVATPFIPPPSAGRAVFIVTNGYALWQQEFGLNQVSFIAETAVTASITTCDISWVGGDPSQDTNQAINRRMHLRRIEPDFVQEGEMTMNIVGRKFARGTYENNGPYSFSPDTGKIDLRIEHREMNLQFVSNTIDGNFEMGRILITAEYGDERP